MSENLIEFESRIAERTMEIYNNQGQVEQLNIYIGKPEPDPLPGGDFRCPVQFIGYGDEKVRYAYGIDSMQALTLAFKLIDARLQNYRNNGFILKWPNE